MTPPDPADLVPLAPAPDAAAPAPNGASPETSPAAPAPPPAADLVLLREGSRYTVALPQGFRLRFEQLHPGARGSGWRARVVLEAPGAPGAVVYQGRHLLEGRRSVAELRAALSDCTGPAIPWDSYLGQLLPALIATQEAPETVLPVGQLPPATPPRYHVAPLLLERAPTVLYGPGGHGKGWLAASLAVHTALGHAWLGRAIQQGPVLYLDWEDDAAAFRYRVEALLRGLDQPAPVSALPVYYWAQSRPLPTVLEPLERLVATLRPVLLIIDSVELASPPAGEGSWNERAVELFRALRRLPTTILLLDHVTGDAMRQGQRLAGRSLGGVMKYNLARAAWEIRADHEPGRDRLPLGLYHTKSNHTKLQEPFGVTLHFAEDAVRLVASDVRASPVLAAPSPLAFQLRGLLAHRPYTLAELVDLVHAERMLVLQTLEQHPAFVRLPDGRWGLAVA